MKKLSKKEWVAIAVAIVLVGYTMFGADIISLFQQNKMSGNQMAATESAAPNQVVVNDVVVGQGPEIKPGQTLTVDYVLSLSDGTVIQNSKDIGQPFKFVLGAGEVIPGFDQGVLGMKVGGVRTMIIPSSLAYGTNQVGPIPPNSTLIFTIDLLDATDTVPQAE